jgi:pentatricopeptide repeat protein
MNSGYLPEADRIRALCDSAANHQSLDLASMSSAFRLVARLVTHHQPLHFYSACRLMRSLASTGTFDSLSTLPDFETLPETETSSIRIILRVLVKAATAHHLHSEAVHFLHALGVYSSPSSSARDISLFRITLFSALASERRYSLHVVADFLRSQADQGKPWRHAMGNTGVVERFFSVALAMGDMDAAGRVYGSLYSGRITARQVVNIFEHYARRAFPERVGLETTTREEVEQARGLFERLCGVMGLDEGQENKLKSFPMYHAIQILGVLCVRARGQQERARRLYVYLRRRGRMEAQGAGSSFQIEAKTMILLVKAFVKTDADFAQQVIADFVTARVRPSAALMVTKGFDRFDLSQYDCTTLVRAFFALDDYDTAFALYRYMLKHKIVFDLLDVNVALLGLFRREPRKAISVLHGLVGAGFRPSASTLSALISSAREQGAQRGPPLQAARRRLAAEIENELFELARSLRLPLNQFTLDMLIRADRRSPMHARVSRLQGMLLAPHKYPSVRPSLVGQLLLEAAKQNDLQCVRRLLQLALEHTVPIGEFTLHAVVALCMAAYKRRGQPSNGVVWDLRKILRRVLRFPPAELETYKLVLNLCKMMDMVNLAVETHDRMMLTGIEADEELASGMRDWLSGSPNTWEERFTGFHRVLAKRGDDDANGPDT